MGPQNIPTLIRIEDTPLRDQTFYPLPAQKSSIVPHIKNKQILVFNLIQKLLHSKGLFQILLLSTQKSQGYLQYWKYSPLDPQLSHFDSFPFIAKLKINVTQRTFSK